MKFSHMSVLVYFLFIFEDLSNYVAVFRFWRFQFLFIAFLTPNLKHLGNTLKKLVGDIIPYYDSTHKIRKKYFWMKLYDLGTTMWPTICKDLNFLGMGFLRMGIDEYVKETKFVFPFLLLRSRFSRCISLC